MRRLGAEPTWSALRWHDLIGSWSKAKESEFVQAIGGLEEIDSPLWR